MKLTFICGGISGGRNDEARRVEDQTMTATLAEMRGYWQALRRNGALPRRSAIEPRGMAGALAGAFLVERIAPGIARLRVAGRQIGDLLGMEGAGLPLSALFEPLARPRLAEVLEACLTAPATLDLRLGSDSGIGRPRLRARMVLLPVASDFGRGEMALGCLCLAGAVGRQPRRLTIEDIRQAPIDLPRYRKIPALEQFAPAPADPDPAGFVEKPHAKARPWLRLVDLTP